MIIASYGYIKRTDSGMFNVFRVGIFSLAFNCYWWYLIAFKIIYADSAWQLTNLCNFKSVSILFQTTLHQPAFHYITIYPINQPITQVGMIRSWPSWVNYTGTMLKCASIFIQANLHYPAFYYKVIKLSSVTTWDD
jgi:hypothetical protein